MAQWMWKRWVWGVLAGGAVAGSAVIAQVPTRTAAYPRQSVSAPPVTHPRDASRPGEVITLRVPGQPDRKVFVLKRTRMPNGKMELEGVDSQTGQRFVLVQPAKPVVVPVKSAVVPVKSAVVPVKPAVVPVKPVVVPVKPAVATSTTQAASENGVTQVAGSDRRLFGFLRPTPSTPETAPGISSNPTSSSDESPSRPGPLQRLFGRKPDEPSKPGMSLGFNPLQRLFGRKSDEPSAPAMPNGVNPLPGKLATPAPQPNGTTTFSEPPRANYTPVQPPRPMLVVPVPVPTKPPVTTVPMTPPASIPPVPLNNAPIPLPMNPPASVPKPMPLPAGSGTVPVIPVPPGSTSSRQVNSVMPVRYTPPAAVTAIQELQPHVHALQTAVPPTNRMLAAESLANCRHGSSEVVKAALFDAAKTDPCPAVRACCIDNLVKLGYFAPAFQQFVNAACEDSSEEVRTAARNARAKMTPRQR